MGEGTSAPSKPKGPRLLPTAFFGDEGSEDESSQDPVMRVLFGDEGSEDCQSSPNSDDEDSGSTSKKSLSSLSVGVLCQHLQRQHSGKRTRMTRKLPNRNACMTIAKGPKRLRIQDRLQRVPTRRTELILKDCESCFLLLLVSLPLTAF